MYALLRPAPLRSALSSRSLFSAAPPVPSLDLDSSHSRCSSVPVPCKQAACKNAPTVCWRGLVSDAIAVGLLGMWVDSSQRKAPAVWAVTAGTLCRSAAAARRRQREERAYHHMPARYPCVIGKTKTTHLHDVHRSTDALGPWPGSRSTARPPCGGGQR